MMMTKQLKLKELLSQLDSLQHKEVLPNDLDGLIKNEVASFEQKLKSDTTVKALVNFQNEITKFRQDFNLEPVTALVRELQQEITNSQNLLVGEFEKKLLQVKKSIPEIPEPVDISRLEDSINILRTKLLTNKFDPKPLQKELDTFKAEYQKALKDDTQSDLILQATLEQRIKEEIKQVKIDFASRLSHHGGGSMNRKISVGGTVMSTRYTDVNFKAGSNVTLTKADNNTTKQVDITIASSGGGGGGTWNTGVFVGNGVTTVFSLPGAAASYGAVFLTLNGQVLSDKNILSSGYDYNLDVDLTTITVVSAPLASDKFIYKYQ